MDFLFNVFIFLLIFKMEGLLGGLAGSGGSSAGIGNLLSAFGGQGGQGQFSGLMGSGGGADVGQILSIIQQNPQLMEQGFNIFKGVGKGVGDVLKQIIPNSSNKLEMQKLLNEQRRLELESQRLRRQERMPNTMRMDMNSLTKPQTDKANKTTSKCKRCNELRQKMDLTEEEKIEMQNVCSEIVALMDQNGLGNMSLEQFCALANQIM
jgi:hypothetical protein